MLIDAKNDTKGTAVHHLLLQSYGCDLEKVLLKAI